MSEKTDKCAKPGCHCPARMESNHCCESCEKEERDPEAGCRCEHPECAQSSSLPTV